MAAHVLTGLKQVVKRCRELAKVPSSIQYEKEVEHYRKGLVSAFQLSCWTEDLFPGTWAGFLNFVEFGTVEEIRRFADILIPKASKKHKELGHPATREEWHQKAKELEIVTWIGEN